MSATGFEVRRATACAETHRKIGSFHETAKVVNSLCVSTAGITQ